MSCEEKEQWMKRATKYAEENSKGEFTWVRDALYVAYLSGIQDALKVRFI